MLLLKIMTILFLLILKKNLSLVQVDKYWTLLFTKKHLIILIIHLFLKMI